MRSIFLAGLAAAILSSCKKDRVCQCKSNDPTQADFAVEYKSKTSGQAKDDCAKENDFWSPTWTCTVK